MVAMMPMMGEIEVSQNREKYMRSYSEKYSEDPYIKK